MPGPSPFAGHWRASLREQYLYIVRIGDKRTEATLRALMIAQLGFSENDLRELYIRATMHVDAVGADFVPDADFVRALEADADALLNQTAAARQGDPAAAPAGTVGEGSIADAVIAAIAAQMDARLEDHAGAEEGDPAADTVSSADTTDDDAADWPPPAAPAQLSLF